MRYQAALRPDRGNDFKPKFFGVQEIVPNECAAYMQHRFGMQADKRCFDVASCAPK
jgi:hypothetical protein